MNNRKECILDWINSRKKRNQAPIKCLFDITIPQLLLEESIETNESIKEIINIFNKYNIRWNTVDTVSGSFCLDREWIEANNIPCYIEYCGVYPVEWDIDDIYKLEQMEYEGKIIINVKWHLEDDNYVPNH
jgi:hypothetical protein